MFCDEVLVHFTAGKGGNGCISFRREKFVSKGGPNGGEAGRGGNIFLQADENINTLAEFNSHKYFKAQNGENGLPKLMGGKNAEDLILPVPVGTMIFDETKKKMIGDLQKNGDMFLVARGGRGGFGNGHFATSIRQTPRFAELGEPGEEKHYVLELKLVADVGIIGLPSVGKSTMISRISNARPKIAEYHFTTIIPNLGLVTMKQFGGSSKQSFVACDLPGLIEGAHEGKGLGIQFLKHVVRNRILVHLLDVNSIDPVADYKTIMNELKSYDKKLAKKPQIIAFNKIDSIDQETLDEIIKSFKKGAKIKQKIFSVSCVTGKGLKELMFAIWELLKQEMDKNKKIEAEPKADFKIYRPTEDTLARTFTIKKLKNNDKLRVFEVSGRRIVQIVVMTDFNNPEAVARAYDVVEKMGIHRELQKHGARFGDEFKIGKHTLLYRWD